MATLNPTLKGWAILRMALRDRALAAALESLKGIKASPHRFGFMQDLPKGRRGRADLHVLMVRNAV